MNGENVYPAEVEKTIFALAQVAQVAVIGVPKAPQGEVGVAFVVKSAAISPEQIIAHCAQKLASYKVPIKVQFIDQLPLNAAGKVLKTQLRKLAQKQ